jgi:class 3 adenylate cyclase
MGLKADLETEVAKIFRDQWTERESEEVPAEDSIRLGNDAVKLLGTVMYADLSESTDLVNSFKPHFAAEVYKTFLYCAAKIVSAESADITAYDGDRIMAVFTGSAKNTRAVRTAMKINYARSEIINPLLAKQYAGRMEYTVRHVAGVDMSNLFVARTGIRGSNDLVWVGRAANYAAKLSALSNAYASYVTGDVYNNLHESVKVSNGQSMWTQVVNESLDGVTIYGSNWWWRID